ncbi:MAG: FAD:protein FMN transferase [Akkermansiaceae bacterium]|nr:FAD:protein FMN transferase [Verrucomicrobiales bacterium]
MSEPAIHVFSHHAMATYFQVRLAGEERDYAAQAARTAFDLLDHLEALLSRFRENSEISQTAQLGVGESLRLSEPTFSCLQIAHAMEQATQRAFCISPIARQTQPELPHWSLVPAELSIRCDSGKLEFDLGAIGKGFALDRMAEELSDWGCGSFLLVAGGSSILAGAPPVGTNGWSSGLGDDNSPQRYLLANCSLSGSGMAAQGEHIFDPRTGLPAPRRERTWAIANTAAESDALSTACMVLSETEIAGCLTGHADWLAIVTDGQAFRSYGNRPWLLTRRSD